MGVSPAEPHLGIKSPMCRDPVVQKAVVVQVLDF